MSRTILLIGESGKGKSTSLRNLDPDSTMIISPNSKPLPFKGAKKMYNIDNKNYANIRDFKSLTNALNTINSQEDYNHIKTVVVEDISHYFTFKVMKDAKKQGYDKWNELALEAYNAFLAGEQDNVYRDDLTLVLIGHVAESTDSNGVRIQTLYTPGKVLDNKVKIPSYVTYQFFADTEKVDGKTRYYFLTNDDGSGREAKTPMGMFENPKIDNDLAEVIKQIEEYE